MATIILRLSSDEFDDDYTTEELVKVLHRVTRNIRVGQNASIVFSPYTVHYELVKEDDNDSVRS